MKKFLSKIFLFLSILLLITACDLFNNKDDKPIDKFLVSYELEKSYLPNWITLAFNQLESTYPDVSAIKEKIEDGVMVYKISYKTIYNNELKIASGLVCVPTGRGPYPILSYQNGTNTLHSNAPSVNPDYELYLLLEFVASTGFVVVIPDYLGFGESSDMFHPYLDKESSNKSIIDMLRATRELAGNYLDKQLDGDLYIAGYSQGGWATLQLHNEIETKYMDEFNLKASACSAGPYNLTYFNSYVTGLTTYPMPYFLGYLFNSYINTGDITTPIGQVFKEPYAAKIPTLFNGTKSGEEINTELTTNISGLFTANYLSNYATAAEFSSVKSTLEANSIVAWNTKIPLMLIHGMEDNFVPKEITSNIYQSFLQQGVNIGKINLKLLPATGHTTGIVPSGLASVKWFLELKDN
jgi:pimeloyl-ACP methyl ester carboxylesterase